MGRNDRGLSNNGIVAVLGGGGISAQPFDDRVQVVCSAGHVDVDGLVRHGGDDIVVGAGNSQVGARVRLARPYTTWVWPARVTWPANIS